MTTKTKILLFSILVIAISVATVNTAFAETREQKIERLLSEAKQVYLKTQGSEDVRIKANLENQLDVLTLQLEEFGITKTEKYEKDREYWSMKSSEHLNGKFVNSPIGNFILPMASAATSAQFMLGYAHECSIIFTCHAWTGVWTTIPETMSNWQKKNLSANHAWLEAKWQIRATNTVVSYSYAYTLKDAAGTTKQTQTSTHQTLHNGVDVIAFKIMPRYNNPANNWEVKTTWTVHDVT